MLSRLEDARVFESSEDVILASRVHQRTRYPASDAVNEVAEDEQLHPQHPYRMRKRVLHQERASLHDLVNPTSGQYLVPFNGQDKRPMEFVFLSSGEIRAREDCPSELGLPKLQQRQDNDNGQFKKRLEYQGLEDSASDEAEGSDYEDNQKRRYAGYEQDNSRRTKRKEMSRPQNRRPVTRHLHKPLTSSLSSSSDRSASSSSDDADISSDSESEATGSAVVSIVSERRENTSRTANRGQSRRQTTRNAEKQGTNHKHSATRNSVRNTPTPSLKLNHLQVEDQVSEHSPRQERAAPKSRREIALFSEVPSRRANRPAPLEQVSQSESTTDVPSRRTKRSPKMEVSHLVSEEPTPPQKGRSTSSSRKEAKLIERLESELQKEKKRVLDKMTQLLDEQGKSQDLRDQVEALETQLTTKQNDMSIKEKEAVREQEERRQALDKEQADRINSLEEQVHLQETTIARLKQDKDQLKTALKQVKKAGGGLSNEQHSDGEKAVVLRAELDDITGRLEEFLLKVERWKSKSKESLQSCGPKTEMSELLEHLWLEFPHFAGVSAKKDKDSSVQQRQSIPVSDDQADAVMFLKKRLRQREEELRQTHVKCSELKEMCARQCVREADLQNFINEHRLRGNLVIRKNSDTKPNGIVDMQAQTQEEPQEKQHQSAKLKMISSRGTNTPVLYNEADEEEPFVNDEYSDNQEDNDDYEDEYEVQTPKVFVQVGRDGVYEHASPFNSAVAQKVVSDQSRGKRKPQPKQQQRVERIRLVPSPSLAQRYERVATPTSTSSAARRRKSAQQLLGQQQFAPQSSLGECPPGCGSRPSFTRKKTSSAATRKPMKRPAATTMKGAIGVVRPWM